MGSLFHVIVDRAFSKDRDFILSCTQTPRLTNRSPVVRDRNALVLQMERLGTWCIASVIRMLIRKYG